MKDQNEEKEPKEDRERHEKHNNAPSGKKRRNSGFNHFSNA